MSQVAADSGKSKRQASADIGGVPFFGLMVAVWTAFITLLASSPKTVEDVWNWLNGLSLVPEILMWIVLLPWAATYAVWQSSWDHGLRIAIVVIFATIHLVVCQPRPKR